MADVLSQIINDYGVYIVIVIVVGFVIFMVYKMTKKVPQQPDYVKVFTEKSVDEEQLNKTGSYGLKYLYHGDVKLGKITSFSDVYYNVDKRMKRFENEKNIPKERLKIFTVTFKKPMIKFFYGFKKEILKFTERSDYKVEQKKLVFPEYTTFTCVGNHFVTQDSLEPLSRVIEADFCKYLFSTNTNLMAAEMSKISAERPEMAHELALKRLEIEKVKAEKAAKLSSIT